MTCDRDADFAPSPCSRPAPPAARADPARECEDAVLALLTAPALPPDDVLRAVVVRARRLLREAAAS